MPVIDAHVHLYPPELNQNPRAWAEERGEAHWSTLCTRVRANGRPVQSFPRVDDLLRAMDEAGVDRAVLQGWYWENHDSCVEHNRFYANCVCAHPDRLSAFAALNPQASETMLREEIKRAVGAGFCGLGELSPHAQGVSIDDANWRLVLALAGEAKLPVNLHVTDPMSRPYPGRVATPLEDFVRLAREHPRTPFILAHWGARLPRDPALGGEARALRNVFFDTAASPLLYGPEVFGEMAAAVGAERILFGSDYPLELYPKKDDAGMGMRPFIEETRAAGLSADALSAILGGNAARWLSGDRG